MDELERGKYSTGVCFYFPLRGIQGLNEMTLEPLLAWGLISRNVTCFRLSDFPPRRFLGYGNALKMGR